MEFREANCTNFKKGRSEKIKYIVIHYTANNGDTAKDNIDYYSNTPNLSSSAHFFVDENKVCKSVEEKDTAWHCGSKTYKHNECRNSNSIGIELCSLKNEKGEYYFNENTLNNASCLVKSLMAKYNIPLDNVIRHFDVTGKICPAPMVNNLKAWDNFKKRLCSIKTANDIDYALKWKYNITFDSVENEKEFISLLEKEREKKSKLYWVFYKLANK